MSDADTQTQELFSRVQSDDALVKVLETLTIGGLVTQDQVEVLAGLSEKITRKSLESLVRPPQRTPPALRVIPVKLASRTGRPQNAYLPTPEGAEVLRSLFPDAPDHAYRVHDPIEVSALYCMMEVYIAAQESNLLASVEKVLPYGSGRANVRADVLVYSMAAQSSSATAKLIFEIEQQLSRNNLPRLVEKLLHLRGLFTSEQGAEFSPAVRILFNLPADDDGRTLLAWQDALAAVIQQVGSLPFQLYWQPIQEFLDQPEWDTLDTFYLLQPSSLPTAPPPAPEPELPSQDAEPESELQLPPLVTLPEIDLQEMHIVLRAIDVAYQEQFDALISAVDHHQRCQNFFNLKMLIYGASHYPGSNTDLYAAFPYKSLHLLHKYLHSYQLQGLLAQMKPAIPYLRYQASMGIIGFRNALTQFYWDIFLRWHGFARGGPLRVVIQVPDFQDRRSEFYVQVHIDNYQMVNREYCHSSYDVVRLAEKSTAWALEALYLYAYELGLSDKLMLGRSSRRSQTAEVENGSLASS